MNWIPKGYQSAKLVDNAGLILGDADYRVGYDEWDACLRNPHRGLGTYTSQEYAQAAVERAAKGGVAPCDEAQPVASMNVVPDHWPRTTVLKPGLELLPGVYPLYLRPPARGVASVAPAQIDESKLPPRPAGYNDANTDPDSPLVRYGRASKESGLLLEPMADGYWTPWHIANEMLRAASGVTESGQQTIPQQTLMNARRYELIRMYAVKHGVVLPPIGAVARTAGSTNDQLDSMLDEILRKEEEDERTRPRA